LADKIIKILDLKENSITLYDIDNDELSYYWFEESANPETGILVFNTARESWASAFIPGIYTFYLKVSDGELDSNIDDIKVEVLGLNEHGLPRKESLEKLGLNFVVPVLEASNTVV